MYKCLCCNKNYQKKFDENLKMKFTNIILLLREGIYPYEYIGDWRNVMRHHYQKRKIFIVTSTWKILLMQTINMQKRACKDFKITNLGEHHDLYVQCDTLLLTDAFNNFRNMHIEIYELDLARFFSFPD